VSNRATRTLRKNRASREEARRSSALNKADGGAPELTAVLLENSSDGVIAHTLDGHIVFANEPAAEMLGHKRSELSELPAWHWLSVEQLEQLPLRIARLRAEDEIVDETRCRCRDGHLVRVETHSKLVCVEPWGEVVVNTSHDATSSNH
jgi:PAS domain S-box-containing protein